MVYGRARVMALNDGRLTNGWNSNLEKQVSAHEFSLETDRHPPDIHLFGDKWLINRFFIKQAETCRGIDISGLSYKKLSFFNVIIKLSKSSLKFSNWAFLF
ncbi:MAG: hypothetical protein H0X49_05385 [Acidobacteria bacterium]|nr:hypothetical protein [Acidobacteriota bacterium]